jgi:hypothetical protein
MEWSFKMTIAKFVIVSQLGGEGGLIQSQEMIAIKWSGVDCQEYVEKLSVFTILILHFFLD